MTSFQMLSGMRYRVHPLPRWRPVFVAEQRQSSDAHAARHTGFGHVTALLEPVFLGAPLAWVRLDDGQVVARPQAALFDRDALATRRILPATDRSRRTA